MQTSPPLIYHNLGRPPVPLRFGLKCPISASRRRGACPYNGSQHSLFSSHGLGSFPPLQGEWALSLIQTARFCEVVSFPLSAVEPLSLDGSLS